MFSVGLFWILGMIIIERFTLDGILGVVHPNLTKRREFEQSLHNLCVVVGGVTKMREEFLPRGVFHLSIVVGLIIAVPCIIIACHVIVRMVTSN